MTEEILEYHVEQMVADGASLSEISRATHASQNYNRRTNPRFELEQDSVFERAEDFESAVAGKFERKLVPYKESDYVYRPEELLTQDAVPLHWEQSKMPFGYAATAACLTGFEENEHGVVWSNLFCTGQVRTRGAPVGIHSELYSHVGLTDRYELETYGFVPGMKEARLLSREYLNSAQPKITIAVQKLDATGIELLVKPTDEVKRFTMEDLRGEA